MRNNIENPYKVNVNHRWDKAISADFVQVFRRGKLLWIVYLFSAGAVTPMRTTEFNTLNDAEQWAKDKGSEIWTYFPLDNERVRHCVKCDNGFVVLDTLPDQVYCSEACWQSVKQSESKMTDKEKRHLIQRLHSEVRNSEEHKTEYKGYIILNKPYRYWIGTETNGGFVFHISVITMAQVIDWIETSIKIIESRNK